MLCKKCGVETERRGVDISDDVYCYDCDPKYKCALCDNPRMKPIGHTEYCMNCFMKKQSEMKQTRSGFMVIDKTKYSGTEMNENHYKDLNTRVVDDYGNSLRGKQGLDYMKSKGNTYASRLKDYYK